MVVEYYSIGFSDVRRKPFFNVTNLTKHTAILHLWCFRFVPQLVDIYQAVWSNHDPDFFDDDLEEDEAGSDFLRLLSLIRTILWNYADGSPSFAESIVEDTQFFQYLAEDLTAVQGDLEDLDDEITVICLLNEKRYIMKHERII